MTKKLFVVLVVVAAMLVTFTWVMGAKKAEKAPSGLFEKFEFTEHQSPTALPKAELTEKQTTTSLYGEHGTKASATYVGAGAVTGQINIPGGKDFCDLYGNPAFYITDWFWGMEWYANYQDPQEHGCVNVFPFLVDVVGFDLAVDAAISIDVQGFVLDADWTVPDCPVPGAVLCETPIYTIDIPSDGWWTIGLPLQDPCCVNFPYFAGIYIYTDLYGSGADAIAEDDPTDVCRSYNDYGAGWEDLVAIYVWPGEMILWSTGWTEPQNDCGCCQYPDSCSCAPLDNETDCVNAGGVWFEGYVCIDDSCQPYGEPEPEGCCEFADSCEDGMTEADCMAAGGTDWFDYATNQDIECIDNEDCGIPIDTTCELMNDNGSAASYGSMFDVGDQNATYLDPGVLCDCDPIYPLRIEKVKAALYDYAGVGTVDVIVHFYEVGAKDLCNGPGVPFYSYGPVTVTDFYGDWAEIVLPEVVCVDGPFFLALEYASGTVGSIPCVLFDTGAPVDTCYQWNDYQDYGWIEWWDFWSTPADVGWLMLRAVGVCNSGACPIACDLIQDAGWIAYYFGSFAAGDAIAKYFDPEEYCEPEVYPYKIHDVDFLLYDFGGVGTVDIIVDVHIVCHDTCDGPGTRIYQSPPITVTTFYGDMAHVVLPEQVCVWEPFFISIEYASGIQGSTPSFLWPDETAPCDSCHVWMYWASGGYPFWIEWNDFWEPPAGGCPIIRVTGFTNHPHCDAQPCEEDLVTLWGGPYPAYFWQQPPNDEFLNMQFTMPVANAGRLDEIEIAFYSPGTYGTPDPDIYVWLSDGVYPLDNNPPYQAIAEFHVDYDSIDWFPLYTVVYTWEKLIEFDAGEKFHIGASHAFETDDTLAHLSDDEFGGSDGRASGWDGSAWGSYSPYGFMINAVICPYPAEDSTFTISASPYINYATPGDPEAVKYTVDVGSLLGYVLGVGLSCTPPRAGINVSFDPAYDTAPFTSEVTISVDAGTDYGDYTLTFVGTGDDGQVKDCDVILKVQPPYDEYMVDFYHGKQRATNYGAVGNANQADNFVWYDRSPLFDGGFIIATDEDHVVLDAYDCEYWGWVPTGHMVIDTLDKYNAYRAKAGFCCDYAVSGIPDVPGECDSVFFVGLMDSCIDFSIKIKIYHNVGPDPITDMYVGVFEDWDVGDDWGDMDTLHNLIWMWDVADPATLFGLMKAPFYDEFMHSMLHVHNPTEVYPTGDSSFNCGNDPGLPYLYRLMSTPGYRPIDYWSPDPDDRSILMTAPPFSLDSCEKHIEIWINFGTNQDLSDPVVRSQWYHRVLRYVGFYRGDVNCSDTLEIPAVEVTDLVYLIQYLFQSGPAPLPYVDQGDVNADGKVDVQDVVYMINYIFAGCTGPAPMDCIRFIEQKWCRPSLFADPNWR